MLPTPGERPMSAGTSFAAMAGAFADRAEAAGFPAFLTPVALSNPLNATPYLLSYERFEAWAGAWPVRRRQVAALGDILRRAEAGGVSVEALFVGGSFTDTANPAPGDLDCLLLYRQADPGRVVDVAALAGLQSVARQEGVDARFIPVDGDPLVLIKTVSYFTLLYAKRKTAPDEPEVRIVRGLLLVDCQGR
jgi:hypothetical protein